MLIKIVLEPGGHLQWFEPLPRSTKVINSEPDVPSAASERLVQIWHNLDPHGEYRYVVRGACYIARFNANRV